jgi:hypothetical protein
MHDLVPVADNAPASLAGWALRQEVETRLGRTVTHAQLCQFHRKGFLAEPNPDGTWPADTVGRLTKALELEREARSLDRRLLIFRRTFYVHSAKLRHAMLAMAGSATGIKRRSQKMQRVDAAFRWWIGVAGGIQYPNAESYCPNCGYPLGAVVFPQSHSRGRQSQSLARLPPARAWEPILQSDTITPETFQDVNNELYCVLDVLLANDRNPYKLDTIPVEELITLLTIRHLAILQEATIKGVAAG